MPDIKPAPEDRVEVYIDPSVIPSRVGAKLTCVAKVVRCAGAPVYALELAGNPTFTASADLTPYEWSHADRIWRLPDPVRTRIASPREVATVG